MEVLYAPWRIDYVLGKKEQSGCVFCLASTGDEEQEALIVHRAEGAFTMMNKYPYANGHVLICPYGHVSDLCDLTAEENSLLIEEVARAVRVIRDVMRPSGFNVGLNIGADAGAGIDEHLHYHVVPRWRGDTNMMSVLANVRVIPEDLFSTTTKLRESFERLFPDTVRGV
jgi:ATP adenylyltransferase